jgi:chromosome segregation ATPase
MTAATQKDVQAAHADVLKAQEALDREEKRLAETQDEIQRLTDEVQATDPDDDKAFSRLVAARDAARGRAEALEVREEKARRTLKAAENAHAAATRDVLRARVAELDAKIREQDAALGSAVRELRKRLTEGAAKLSALVGQANEIECSIDPEGFRITGRGSFWASVGLGTELQAAADRYSPLTTAAGDVIERA